MGSSFFDKSRKEAGGAQAEVFFYQKFPVQFFYSFFEKELLSICSFESEKMWQIKMSFLKVFCSCSLTLAVRQPRNERR
jgi:hypothetical protein